MKHRNTILAMYRFLYSLQLDRDTLTIPLCYYMTHGTEEFMQFIPKVSEKGEVNLLPEMIAMFRRCNPILASLGSLCWERKPQAVGAEDLPLLELEWQAIQKNGTGGHPNWRQIYMVSINDGKKREHWVADHTDLPDGSTELGQWDIAGRNESSSEPVVLTSQDRDFDALELAFRSLPKKRKR